MDECPCPEGVGRDTNQVNLKENEKMKIIALCRAYRSVWTMAASVNSVYKHVEKVLYVLSAESWTGKNGYGTAELEINKIPDPDQKIIKINCDNHGRPNAQEDQFSTAAHYLMAENDNKPDFDYLMFLDADEVWADYYWTEIKPILEENINRLSPAKAICCRIHNYMKSPFYRVDPPAEFMPVCFIHKSAFNPESMALRGCGVRGEDRISVQTVFFHHFCYVRESLTDVWEKNLNSSSVESTAVLDKETWVNEIWNRLPQAKNVVPQTQHREAWPGIRVVGIEDLPESIRDHELVRAWQKYPIEQYGALPGYGGVTKEDLVKAGLPADFGSSHPDWTIPSKQNRYRTLKKGMSAGPRKIKDETILAIKRELPVMSNITVEDLRRVGLSDGFGPSHPDWNMNSKQNRLHRIKVYTGSFCIFTIVSGKYQWYLPMWFDRIEKELPEAKTMVYVRGNMELPDPWRSKCLVDQNLDEFRMDGYTTAALRFVYSNPELEAFDYVLVTDCDMLMRKETPDLINQHMRSMMRTGLQCYDNYISGRGAGGRPKVPGVNFVTREWWERTRSARETHRNNLLKNGSTSWEWDEIMLGWIIEMSKLPISEELRLWAHHGIHLGDWRRRLNTKVKFQMPDAPTQNQILDMLQDNEFMKIVDMCKDKLEQLEETFEIFKKAVSL
jgi:hypothetical protein